MPVEASIAFRRTTCSGAEAPPSFFKRALRIPRHHGIAVENLSPRARPGLIARLQPTAAWTTVALPKRTGIPGSAKPPASVHPAAASPGEATATSSPWSWLSGDGQGRQGGGGHDRRQPYDRKGQGDPAAGGGRRGVVERPEQGAQTRGEGDGHRQHERADRAPHQPMSHPLLDASHDPAVAKTRHQGR